MISAALKSYRKKNGVGEQVEEVLFYGYKEPLKKVEGGFGYMGVLSYNKNRDKMQCHICGGLFRNVGLHAALSHDVQATAYKEKYQLSEGTALVGEGTRTRMSLSNNLTAETLKSKNVNLKRLREGFDNWNKQHPKRRKKSLEQRNREGTCPDQLLAVIDRTCKSFGRVPTKDEFADFHKGRYIKSIWYTFGSWTNALRQLKLRPNWEEYSEEYLLEAMRNFHKVHKRAPRSTDWKRGLLPSENAYMRKFGSIVRARLLSGTPLLVRVGRYQWDEWTPDVLEISKMLNGGKLEWRFKKPIAKSAS